MTKKSKQKSYFVPRVFTNPTRLPSEPRFMHTAAAGRGGSTRGTWPACGLPITSYMGHQQSDAGEGLPSSGQQRRVELRP
jgi:hypothetical protein